MNRNLAPERELFNYLSSPALKKDTVKLGNGELSNNFNWEYLLKLTNYEKDIAPLIYFNLKHYIKNESIPGVVMDNLELSFNSNRARNTILLQEISHLLQLFLKERIKVLVLKGISFVETIYEDIGLRSMGDIDILIDKDNLVKIEDILDKEGYSLDHYWNSHVVYSKSSPIYICLEFHPDIYCRRIYPLDKNLYQTNLTELWNEAVLTKINGVEAYVMGLEDTIIYLSWHLLKDYYENRKWFIDIDRFIVCKGKEVNWERLLEKIGKTKTSRMVYFVLEYVYKNFDTPIPDFVLSNLKPTKISFIEGKIFNNQRPHIGSMSWYVFLYLSLMERKRDKIKSILGLFPYLLIRRLEDYFRLEFGW